MIEIMNLRNTKPSEPYDFYIDRRSAVGNVYPMKNKSEQERNRVCEAYQKYFDEYPDIKDILLRTIKEI